MLRGSLISALFLLASGRDSLFAQQIQPPALVIPSFDDAAPSDVSPGENPVEAQVESERRALSPDAVNFIRGIALLLIPTEFDDDDGWGDKTKIQSGLNVRFDNGKIKTNRRWKHVNHGNWMRVTGKLVDPQERFLLHAAHLADPEPGTKRYEVDVSARIRATGQQQQWSHGLMLWSVSAEAIADVHLHLVLDTKSEVVQTDEGSRLRFLPKVTEAQAQLTDYSLRRISHLKGKPVQEFGDLFEKIVRRRVNRENEKLATRINATLEKKPDRLEIPFDVADWFGVAKEHEIKPED